MTSLQRLFHLETRSARLCGKWQMRTPVQENGTSLQPLPVKEKGKLPGRLQSWDFTDFLSPVVVTVRPQMEKRRTCRFRRGQESIAFRHRQSNTFGPGSQSPRCWLVGQSANQQGGEVCRRWGAPGLRSEDVSSSDSVERLALPKGESLNAIRAPGRRARRASRCRSTPAQSTPIHSVVRAP